VQDPANAPGGNITRTAHRASGLRVARCRPDLSQPVKINAVADRSDQFNQRLAVDPETG
jgi:hypothetical protein